jgi:hypothetical protein
LPNFFLWGYYLGEKSFQFPKQFVCKRYLAEKPTFVFLRLNQTQIQAGSRENLGDKNMKMKITLALTFFLCLTMSAFAQDTMKTDDKKSKKMTNDQMLMNQEQMAWKAIQDKRWDDFANMLADNYEGVYDDGIHNKTLELNGVKQSGISGVTVSDMRVNWIDKDAAIVTAVVRGEGNSTEGKMSNFSSRTATVWKKSGKNWVIIYHTNIMMK